VLEREFDLSIGDVLRVGDHLVTVVDIDGEDVSFRIEDSPEEDLVLESTQWLEYPR